MTQVLGSGGQTVNAVGQAAMSVQAATVRIVGSGVGGVAPLIRAVERLVTGGTVTLATSDGVLGGNGTIDLPLLNDQPPTPQAFIISAFGGALSVIPHVDDGAIFDLDNQVVTDVTVATNTAITLLRYLGVWRVIDSSAGVNEQIAVADAGYGFASRERISAKAQPVDPIVTYDTETWDASEIREPGAAIYDPETDLWILPYTAEWYDAPLTITQVAAVLSSDGGETWTAHPQNPILPVQPWEATNPEYEPFDLSFDDPYVAKTVDGEVWRDSDGRAHIYVEEKMNLTHVGIGRWVSGVNTLDDWTYTGRVLEPGGGVFPAPAPSDVWDYTDRASPVVLHDGTRLNMLFEGRNLPTSARYDEWVTATAYAVGDIVWVDGSPLTFYRCVTAHTSSTVPPGAQWEVYVGQLGATGHAISTDDGETWTPHDLNPVIPTTPEGTWAAESIVIDDIIKVGAEWIALAHGISAPDDTYTVGRFRTTDDPIDWTPDSFTECVGNPYDTTTNTMMCWGNDPTQGVRILQLVSNTGVGELLERVWITPTVGTSDGATFDPSGLQGQIDTLDGRVDIHDTDLTAVDSRLDALENPAATVDAAALAAHFAADVDPARYPVADAWSDIYDLAGPGAGFQELDGTSVLDPTPGPLSVVPSYPGTEPQQGAVTVVPSPPTAGAVLYGLRLYGVEVSGELPEADQFVSLSFVSGMGAAVPQQAFLRGTGADGWTISGFDNGVALATGVAVPAGPVDVLMTLQPSDVTPIAAGVIFYSTTPPVSHLPTVTIDSVEWLWRVPVEDLIDAAPTPDATTIISTPTTITEPGYYYLVDGADVTLPSAAANVGADLYLQTTGTGDATITPFSGDAVQNAFDGFTSTAWDWAPEIVAHWRAASAAEFGGVPAWVAVSLDASTSGGGIPATIIDADSDLIVGTAADTAGRLAVPASTIVGRKASGSITALTPAEARAIIDDEWHEVARYTTVSSNDWPTFSSVPTADRYRLRWFYAPTGSPAGSGGLARNLVLTLDGDTTANTYMSNGSQSALGILVAAFGQGGGGFGHIDFHRTVLRFSGAPVIRYGVQGMVDATASIGAVFANRSAFGAAYVKLDGAVPDLSTWAIASSNNDVWRAGITFILETASLP